MKIWLTGEGLWYTIGSLNPSVDQSTISFRTERDNAKAVYWLQICIDEDDRKIVRNLESAKQIWDTLQDKYEEKLQVSRRQYLRKFTHYTMPKGTTIQQAWTYLATLGRKIASIEPENSNFAKERPRLQQLL